MFRRYQVELRRLSLGTSLRQRQHSQGRERNLAGRRLSKSNLVTRGIYALFRQLMPMPRV